MGSATKKTSKLTWFVFAALLLFVYISVKNGGAVDPEDRTQSLDKAEKNHSKEKANTDFDREMSELRRYKEMVISEGTAATKAILKDPDSAVFKDVYYNKRKDTAAAACGFVNSKNSYGGFSGFVRFASAGMSDVTYVEGSHNNFEAMWKELCLSN